MPPPSTVGRTAQAYTLSFVWSRPSASVELTTHYTTADTVLEIGAVAYERKRGINRYKVPLGVSN